MPGRRVHLAKPRGRGIKYPSQQNHSFWISLMILSMHVIYAIRTRKATFNKTKGQRPTPRLMSMIVLKAPEIPPFCTSRLKLSSLQAAQPRQHRCTHIPPHAYP
jgi:hypothetical protein